MSARYLKIATRAHRVQFRYPLRSSLLMLMAALGVVGVVCSTNYGAAGTRQILDQIRRMGANVLIITPAESRARAGRARTGGAVTTLVDKDYFLIRKTIAARSRSSALVTSSFRVKAGDLTKVAAVVGVEPEYFAIRNWPLESGEVFSADNQRTAARYALLGHTVATELFGASLPVGERITINRVPFIVAGVLAERGQGLDISNEDNQVYVPLTTAMRRLMNVDYYSGIVVEIDSANSMDFAAAEMHLLLRASHHIGQSQPDDFQIQNQKTLLDTQLAASSRLKFFLRWIAASALTVSGLGIAAISWIALKERTREIGSRRALGATKNDIFFQILSEAAALAGSGSFLGVAISWPASRFISESAGLPFVFEKSTALFALGVAIAINLAFSLATSRKAAGVSPLKALQYE